MSRKVWIALLAVVVCAVVYVFWDQNNMPTAPSTSISTSSTKNQKVVRIPIISATAVSTLDPIQSVEIAQYDLCNQIFEGLVSVDLQGNFAPGLASHWSHSGDYKIWTFHLREAFFSDDPAFPEGRGRKVNEDDVIFSLKRGLSPQQGSRGSFALSQSVVGAKEYSEGKVDNVAGLRSPEPYVIEFSLIEGDRFFPTALTVPATYIVSREAVELYGANFGKKPVGTGPFKLDSWNEGLRLTLKRNEAFGKGEGTQPRPPKINAVEFIFFRSEAQMINAFKAHEIDLRPLVGADYATVSHDNWQDVLIKKHLEASIVQPGWVLKLHLLAAQMGDTHPLGSEDGIARQALRQILASRLNEINAFQGIGRTQNLLMPDILISNSSVIPTVIKNPEEILKARVSGRTIRVAYASTRVNDIIINVLDKVLSDAGATVLRFPSTSINAVFGSLATVNPDLTLIYWSPYYPNVSEFLTALLTTSQPVPNFTGFSAPELDALAIELKRGSQDSTYVTGEICVVLERHMPWIPLYLETPYYLVSNRLHGFSISPVSVTQLTAIDFKN